LFRPRNFNWRERNLGGPNAYPSPSGTGKKFSAIKLLFVAVAPFQQHERWRLRETDLFPHLLFTSGQRSIAAADCKVRGHGAGP
jgi:hypothetical protein